MTFATRVRGHDVAVMVVEQVGGEKSVQRASPLPP